MPITLTASPGIRTTVGKSPKAVVPYTAFGSEVEADVRAALLAAAPLTYDGLLRWTANLSEVGGGVWQAEVEYGQGEKDSTADPLGAGDPYAPAATDPVGADFSADTTGATVHITQSLETVDSDKLAADAGAIPDTKRGINVGPDGVEGVDIVASRLEYTETWTFPRSVVTWGYVKRIRDLTGRTNDDTWRNFAEGEVLFLGASIRSEGQDKVKIDYRFSLGKNETGIVVCAGMNDVDKKGHEYIWVSYKQVQDALRVVSVPAYVYVERVYESADLTTLGIGS